MKTYCKDILLILIVLLSVFPLAANATTFYLDQVNVNNTGTSGPWATVTLTDSTFAGKDSVHFEVTPIESAFSTLGANFGLQTFYFSENTTFGSSLLVGNFVPTGWSFSYGSPVGKKDTDKGFNAGGDFGKFEFLADGNGNTRANPLSFDVYTDTNLEVKISDFSSVLSTEGYLFAAHIADYTGGKSAKFATDGTTTPVPEPSTLLLLGGGLIGLAFYRRRKN